jgi:hypothetical protein
MSEHLRERFAAMADNGLLDVKFDIRMMPDDGGLKEPIREFAATFSAENAVKEKFFADVCAEVEALYRAVDEGLSSPLDFGDSSHQAAIAG